MFDFILMASRREGVRSRKAPGLSRVVKGALRLLCGNYRGAHEAPPQQSHERQTPRAPSHVWWEAVLVLGVELKEVWTVMKEGREGWPQVLA